MDLESRARAQRATETRRFSADHSTLSLKGVTAEKRKPDVVLLPESALAGRRGWFNVLAIIEITREANFPSRIMKECDQRALMILRNTPGREFFPLIAISGRKFRIFNYHRSGVSRSPIYDMVKNVNGFYYIILSLLLTKLEALGFDPNITFNRLLQPTHITFCNKLYEIKRNLYTRDGIQGRGTVCWEVKCPDTHKHYLLKTSWVNKGRRRSEVEFYKEMAEHRVKGVPILIHAEESKAWDGVSSTRKWRPESENNNSTTFIIRTCCKLLLDGIGKPLTEFTSKYELICAIIDIIESMSVRLIYLLKSHHFLAHQRLLIIGILHRDLSLWNLFLIDKLPEYSNHGVSEENTPRQQDREHSVSVDSPREQSVSAAQSHRLPAPQVPTTRQDRRNVDRAHALDALAQSSSTSTVSPNQSTTSDVTSSSANPSVSPLSDSQRALSVVAQPRLTTPRAQHGTARESEEAAHGDLFSPVGISVARGLLSDFDYAAYVLWRAAREQEKASSSEISEEESQLRMRTVSKIFFGVRLLYNMHTGDPPIYVHRSAFRWSRILPQVSARSRVSRIRYNDDMYVLQRSGG